VSYLPWPFVALTLGGLLLWRVDAFARRWAIGQTLAKRVATLEAQVATKASLDEAQVLRDKLTALTNRVGPPR
jgi:hypothetical protein